MKYPYLSVDHEIFRRPEYPGTVWQSPILPYTHSPQELHDHENDYC